MKYIVIQKTYIKREEVILFDYRIRHLDMFQFMLSESDSVSAGLIILDGDSVGYIMQGSESLSITHNLDREKMDLLIIERMLKV